MPLLCFAQKKRDNAILIPSQGITDEKIRTAIVTYGFGIDKADNGYYQTTPGKKEKAPTSKISIFKSDSVYIIQGWYDVEIELMGVKSSFDKTEFRGMKGSPALRAWEVMVGFAKKLSDSLTFIKQ